MSSTNSTEPFRTSPSDYMRLRLSELAAKRWWIVALAITVCLALALWVDTRFIYVTLILIFAVVPVAIFMAWFSLLPDGRVNYAAASSSRRRVSVSTDEIVVEFYPSDDEECTEAERTMTIPRVSVKEIGATGQFLVVKLGEPYNMLLIRLEAVTKEFPLQPQYDYEQES